MTLYYSRDNVDVPRSGGTLHTIDQYCVQAFRKLNAGSWPALPADLLLPILSRVSITEVAAVGSTNKHWARATRDLLRPFRTIATQPSRVRLLLQEQNGNVLLPEDALEEPLHPTLQKPASAVDCYKAYEDYRLASACGVRPNRRLWWLITFDDEQTGGQEIVCAP